MWLKTIRAAANDDNIVIRQQMVRDFRENAADVREKKKNLREHPVVASSPLS